MFNNDSATTTTVYIGEHFVIDETDLSNFNSTNSYVSFTNHSTCETTKKYYFEGTFVTVYFNTTGELTMCINKLLTNHIFKVMSAPAPPPPELPPPALPSPAFPPPPLMPPSPCNCFLNGGFSGLTYPEHRNHTQICNESHPLYRTNESDRYCFSFETDECSIQNNILLMQGNAVVSCSETEQLSCQAPPVSGSNFPPTFFLWSCSPLPSSQPLSYIVESPNCTCQGVPDFDTFDFPSSNIPCRYWPMLSSDSRSSDGCILTTQFTEGFQEENNCKIIYSESSNIPYSLKVDSSINSVYCDSGSSLKCRNYPPPYAAFIRWVCEDISPPPPPIQPSYELSFPDCTCNSSLIQSVNDVRDYSGPENLCRHNVVEDKFCMTIVNPGSSSYNADVNCNVRFEHDTMIPISMTVGNTNNGIRCVNNSTLKCTSNVSIEFLKFTFWVCEYPQPSSPPPLSPPSPPLPPPPQPPPPPCCPKYINCTRNVDDGWSTNLCTSTYPNVCGDWNCSYTEQCPENRAPAFSSALYGGKEGSYSFSISNPNPQNGRIVCYSGYEFPNQNFVRCNRCWTTFDTCVQCNTTEEVQPENYHHWTCGENC